MTGEEFLSLQETFMKEAGMSANPEPEDNSENYTYGIRGIASIFGCSISTANRIKSSGVIDRAIKQIGRKIIINKKRHLNCSVGSIKSRYGFKKLTVTLMN